MTPAGATRPIPDALNAALVSFVSGALATLLFAGARATRPGVLATLVTVFALLFQTLFALFHEAAHGKLCSRPGAAAVLGLVCGAWFGMSPSMFAVTHQGHHLKNRTDEEMFDLYYPTDSRWKKAVVWYGMLIGLWYWTIPLANLVLLVAPGLYRRLALRWRLTQSLFQRPPAFLRRVRVELAFVLAFPGLLCALLGLSPARLLLFYIPATMLWSTVQYLEHAYAPRDIDLGAFNLRAPAWLSWLNLHRELDVNHHRHPGEPWCYLPVLSPAGETRRSYFRHYLSQWGGPRLTREPGPRPRTLTEDVSA